VEIGGNYCDGKKIGARGDGTGLGRTELFYSREIDPMARLSWFWVDGFLVIKIY